jgi:hypothetical protein
MEHFLQIVRLAIDNNNYYIHAICRAELKKSIVYNIDIMIDSKGIICECQCECAAGMGPSGHCKHVCTLLYGLHMFSQTKEILVVETCTEQLQSFNKCKKFKGSPLKSYSINLRKKRSSASVFSQPHFDPRPNNLRNLTSYPAFFQNACINFSNYAPDMPILQTIPPANLQAVSNDHDYLLKTPAEMCLHNLHSQEQSHEIELKTRGQSLSTAWADERCKRIQSSMFGKICKCTIKTDKNNLALSIISPNIFSSASTRYGRKYEAVAVKKYETVTGLKTQECGIFVCEAHSYLGASPDRVVDDNTLLEVKCPYSARNDLINPDTVPYLVECNNELALDPNHNYYYQVQGQLMCSGKQFCDFMIYTQKDVRIIRIERSESFIFSMQTRLNEFFENHLKPVLIEKHLFKNSQKYTFNYKV